MKRILVLSILIFSLLLDPCYADINYGVIQEHATTPYYYYTYVPDITIVNNSHILYIGHGAPPNINDDYEATKEEARYTLDYFKFVADDYGFILMCVAVPRNDEYYSIAIMRNTLTTDDPFYGRPDNKIKLSIEEFIGKLKDANVNISDRILMMGQSASSAQVQRFSYIYPEKVKAVALQLGVGTIPLSEYAGDLLTYPLGMGDIEGLISIPYNIEAVKNISFGIFVGEYDRGSVDGFPDFDESQKDLIIKHFADDEYEFAEACHIVNQSVGIYSEFHTYPVGHEIPPEMINDSLLFLKSIAYPSGEAEIIGTWSSGISYRDVAESRWAQMTSFTTTGDIAAGDFTGDGKADVASIWSSGLWYQDGATLDWTKVSDSAPDSVTAGDATGEGRAEIIGAWSSGIWYYDVAKSKWTKMTSAVPSGDIAAGDFTRDGIADVTSCWDSGLWYQDGSTQSWTKISNTAPTQMTTGDVTGEGRAEIIGAWSSGIWYYDVAKSKWTKMTSAVPSGDIAAGDFTGDGKADVVSSWPSGLWYQDGDTLAWTKVWDTAPTQLTAGDVTGD